MEISGKTAIVTGAASGIGLCIATSLAEAGANVVMADIEKVAVEQAAHRLSGTNKQVLPVRVDVTQEQSVIDALADYFKAEAAYLAALPKGPNNYHPFRHTQAAIDRRNYVIDRMVELDARTLTGVVYSLVGRADAVPAPERRRQWRTVVRNLREVARHAEDRGRRVALEPVNRFETDFLNTCDQGLALIKAVGARNVKLHLDTFHMNIEEKNQAAAILKAGKHLGHFHACGSDRGTPGGDHIDWKPIVNALRKIKYKGDVVIESFTTDVKVIARAAAIWRKIEQNRNDIAVKGLANLRRLFGKKK